MDTNPSTGECIARVRVSTKADVDAAIAAARTAQFKWSAVCLAQRKELVRLAVQRIGEDDTLAKTITQAGHARLYV